MKKLLLFSLFFILAGCGVSNDCKDATVGRLISPSTAKFEGVSSIDIEGLGKATYGRVDSQNGFGVMISHNFICVENSKGAVSYLQGHEKTKSDYDYFSEVIKNNKYDDEDYKEFLEYDSLTDEEVCKKLVTDYYYEKEGNRFVYIYDMKRNPYSVDGELIIYMGKLSTGLGDENTKSFQCDKDDSGKMGNKNKHYFYHMMIGNESIDIK